MLKEVTEILAFPRRAFRHERPILEGALSPIYCVHQGLGFF